MRSATRAAAFAALLAAASGAAANAKEAANPQEDRGLPGDPSAPVAAADCAFAAAHVDPDGRMIRATVSRATAAFAASHAPATPYPFHPVARLTHANYGDDEILGKMSADGVPPAPLTSDAEFLRRVTLDLTGRIPDVAT